MPDDQTEIPLRVLSNKIAGPYLRLPVAQLDQIRLRLDREAIPYRVDSHTLSIAGAPETTYVYFGPEGDAARIQAILNKPG
jgi:hypothetical protein